MPDRTGHTRIEDEDLALAISLSNVLLAHADNDEAEEDTSTSKHRAASPPHELEHTHWMVQDFLSDAWQILAAGDAGGTDTLLLEPLSEFIASCCSCALSLEQRAFVTELIELAAARLLHGGSASLPADVSVVLLASTRFVECSLCALEQACADSLSTQRAALQQVRAAQPRDPSLRLIALSPFLSLQH